MTVERVVLYHMSISTRGYMEMPTQIAATPLLTGEDALRVLEESRIMPTEKTRLGIKMLKEEFAGMVRKVEDDD